MEHQTISRTLTLAGVIASTILPVTAQAATLTLSPTAAKAVTGASTSCARAAAPARIVTPWNPEIPRIVELRNFGEPYGSARVAVDLDSHGALLGSRVVSSTGIAALDDAALVAARRSRYGAESRGCAAQPGTYMLMVNFDG